MTCFFTCYLANVFGCNNLKHSTDSINVVQLYEVSDTVNPCMLTFNTEEQTVQSHDGQEVFCNKRKVEYRIFKTESRIVIKRKILHSEKIVVDKDKSIQNIYPNVTSAVQLCGLLKPGKMKLQELRPTKLACSFSISDDSYEITLHKTGRLPKREETFFGETVRYENVTEELQYKTCEKNFYLDKIKKIVSKMDISVIQKNGIQHKVELVESIVVL